MDAYVPDGRHRLENVTQKNVQSLADGYHGVRMDPALNLVAAEYRQRNGFAVYQCTEVEERNVQGNQQKQGVVTLKDVLLKGVGRDGGRVAGARCHVVVGIRNMSATVTILDRGMAEPAVWETALSITSAIHKTVQSMVDGHPGVLMDLAQRHVGGEHIHRHAHVAHLLLLMEEESAAEELQGQGNATLRSVQLMADGQPGESMVDVQRHAAEESSI